MKVTVLAKSVQTFELDMEPVLIPQVGDTLNVPVGDGMVTPQGNVNWHIRINRRSIDIGKDGLVEIRKIADLYCCQGGAAKGLHDAFPDAEIVGFDIKPQPRYPFWFVQQDALTVDLSEFDLVWASPPCQAYSSMKSLPNVHTTHPKLIELTRERLVASRKPYIIENVVGAPLVNYVTLCGSMFGLRSYGRRYLKRHRLFETSFTVAGLLPPHNHSGQAVSIVGHGGAGHSGMRIRKANAAEARQLLGVDWMTREGMSQAIPPAYARWLGEQFQLAFQQT